MPVKRVSPVNQAITHVQDWADEKLRHLCGRMTPEIRLAVILLMLLFFGGLSIYFTVSSIYRIGKEDGETIRIEHIRQLQLQGKDSTNIFNQSDNGRKRSKEWSSRTGNGQEERTWKTGKGENHNSSTFYEEAKDLKHTIEKLELELKLEKVEKEKAILETAFWKEKFEKR